MKVLYWLIGIVVAIPTLLLAVTYGASELGGEVVTLDRTDSNGEVSRIRVWIVDQNGSTWIEHGDAQAFWITKLSENPRVVVTRKGDTSTYFGRPDPAAHELYHDLRREKYTWAENVIAILGGGSEECTGVPVRLETQD